MDANGAKSEAQPDGSRHLLRDHLRNMISLISRVSVRNCSGKSSGFGILSVAVMLRSANFARVLGSPIVASWRLYEPLLVSYAGGTIGHRRRNLRVVDDRTQENLGLLKSVARSIIKAALGGGSVIAMLTTRRSQAMHDLLTRSAVQVRDLALAGPKLCVHDQGNLADPALPSRTRRVLLIIAYVIASAVLFFALPFFLFQTGLVSQCCLDANRCSLREDLLGYSLVIGWGAPACLGYGLAGAATCSAAAPPESDPTLRVRR